MSVAERVVVNDVGFAALASVATLLIGAFYFKRMERRLTDGLNGNRHL